jgi:hypothetical protein
MTDLTPEDEHEIWLLACKRGIDTGRARKIWEMQKLNQKLRLETLQRKRELQQKYAIREEGRQEERVITERLRKKGKQQYHVLQETQSLLSARTEQLSRDKEEFLTKTNTENLVWKKNLETQLQYEHDKAILGEKSRLNALKNLKSLEYTAKIQDNLEPFEKELSDVIELLSTGRFTKLTLTFLKTESGKILMVVSP